MSDSDSTGEMAERTIPIEPDREQVMPSAAEGDGVRAPGSRRSVWYTLLEAAVILAWTLFVTRDYLNFNLDMWPNGREFGMAIQTHFIWTELLRCGSCMLWNGAINGGSPAFAELHGAVLHPLVIVPTIIWGGINGAKIGLIGALAMAGLAQWWLAKTMRLGVIACLWAGMIAVVGGHLAGRMDIGVFAIVLSTAAASLVIAAGVNLALTGRRRSAIILAITLALAAVAGQGYMQIGLLLAVGPAFLVLLLDEKFHLQKVWREFLLAGGLALLLAGIFLVPFMHFWPNFGKDIDITFGGAQTFGNTLLNLVIADADFYLQGALGTNPYPYQYVIFTGWIPVGLAILSLRLVPKKQTPLLTFFLVGIGLVILLASGVTLSWLAKINEELIAFVRIPSLIAGLAVPLVLALASWSADLLWHKDWPLKLSSPRHTDDGQAQETGFTIPLSWVLVGILLAAALVSAYSFSTVYLGVNQVDPVKQDVVDEIAQINQGKTQWIEFPFGEHFWAPLAFEQGLKITRLVRPWHWRDREDPAPSLSVSTEAANGVGSQYLGMVADLGFEKHDDQHYAYVFTDSEVFPCEARSQGGIVRVSCSTTEAGTLVVQENMVSGWSAEMDGQPIELLPGNWLTSSAPAGEHDYLLRYRPWDVVVGLILTLIGIGLCVWIWVYK